MVTWKSLSVLVSPDYIPFFVRRLSGYFLAQCFAKDEDFGTMNSGIYRVIRNDCRGFNNLSYTIHLRQQYMYFFI